MRTYAVGDIHGRRDLLDQLLADIEADAGAAPRRLVFLGDYIDRGFDSAGVIRAIRALETEDPDQVVALMGNHEDLLVRARSSEEWLETWLYNGGDAALRSFGVDRVEDVPADVIAWVAARPKVFEDEWRCFVHAGLDPSRHRHDQTDEDRLWIRQPFLQADHDFGKLVVHGHTPVRTGVPDLRRHRLNIDTAAVYGGRLTAAVFEGGRERPVGFLQRPA
jgi:serine/threonine protein phosphatase 1